MRNFYQKRKKKHIYYKYFVEAQKAVFKKLKNQALINKNLNVKYSL